MSKEYKFNIAAFEVPIVRNTLLTIVGDPENFPDINLVSVSEGLALIERQALDSIPKDAFLNDDTLNTIFASVGPLQPLLPVTGTHIRRTRGIFRYFSHELGDEGNLIMKALNQPKKIFQASRTHQASFRSQH